MERIFRWNDDAMHRKLAAVVDPTARDLIAKLLQVDPAKRIAAAEALEHPYFHPVEGIRGARRGQAEGSRPQGAARGAKQASSSEERHPPMRMRCCKRSWGSCKRTRSARKNGRVAGARGEDQR